MLTTWFMPAPSLPSESRIRSNVVRTSSSNLTLPLSGGNGTPTWPEMKIQEPARVSMRSASLKVGAIGLGRCLIRSIVLLLQYCCSVLPGEFKREHARTLAGLRIDELDQLVSEKDLNRKRNASPPLTGGAVTPHSNPADEMIRVFDVQHAASIAAV